MLDGITMLNQIDICRSVPGWIVLITIAFAILMGLVAVSLLTDNYNKSGIVLGALCVVASAATIIMFVIENNSTNIVETHYQVTIDDTVSMTEFNERYEIIEQDGLIFTVKERGKQ